MNEAQSQSAPVAPAAPPAVSAVAPAVAPGIVVRRRAGMPPAARVGLAGAALALALLAEHLAADARDTAIEPPPLLTWIGFAVAAVLFVIAAWPVPAVRPVLPAPLGATWRALARKPLVAGSLALAAL